MEHALAIESPHVGPVRNAPASFRRDAAPCPVVNTVPERLQQALAHVEVLERALATSRLAAVAAQRQVEVLTSANAQLRDGSEQNAEHGGKGAPRCLPWTVTDSCLAVTLAPAASQRFGRLLTKRRRFRRYDVIYGAGDTFHSLYTIHVGSCKTVLLARDGHEQVGGYHMAGEIIGVDGIAGDRHACTAIALEDMEVCRLPYEQIERLTRDDGECQRYVSKLLSQESARAYALMLVLGTMRAERRLAMFLLDLSQRYQARGYSASEFVLRMTREEIGSYLGLSLETVSRMFSQFQREGVIQVEGRAVKLLDLVSLRRTVECEA